MSKSIVIDMSPAQNAETDNLTTYSVELPPGTTIKLNEVIVSSAMHGESGDYVLSEPVQLEVTVPHAFAKVERWEHA